MRVGGPAGSSGESPWSHPIADHRRAQHRTKLDFLTYHRYGDDNGLPVADVTDAVAFHTSLLNAHRV